MSSAPAPDLNFAPPQAPSPSQEVERNGAEPERPDVPSPGGALVPAAGSPTPQSDDRKPGRFRRGLGKYVGIKTEDQQQARASFNEVLAQVAAGTADLEAVPDMLDVLRSEADFRGTQDLDLRLAAMRRAIDRVLADDYLSEEEEPQLTGALAALGLSQEHLQNQLSQDVMRLMIARANAGRLNPMDDPELMAKSGEVVYLEVDAQMLKEVTVREYRGGYSGVSFRVMKGVRFNTGGMRGRSVVVGTEIQVADAGFLSITNKRAVFMGGKKTQEYRYDKLVGMQLYSDAITFQVTNRQNATTLAVGQPDLVAAYINAAAQDDL